MISLHEAVKDPEKITILKDCRVLLIRLTDPGLSHWVEHFKARKLATVAVTLNATIATLIQRTLSCGAKLDATTI